MAGVAGRSGRKSWDKEAESKRLWELSVPVLVHALTSKTIDPDRKIYIALELVKKMLPIQLTGKDGGPLVLSVVDELRQGLAEPVTTTVGNGYFTSTR